MDTNNTNTAEKKVVDQTQQTNTNPGTTQEKVGTNPQPTPSITGPKSNPERHAFSKTAFLQKLKDVERAVWAVSEEHGSRARDDARRMVTELVDILLKHTDSPSLIEDLTKFKTDRCVARSEHETESCNHYVRMTCYDAFPLGRCRIDCSQLSRNSNTFRVTVSHENGSFQSFFGLTAEDAFTLSNLLTAVTASYQARMHDYRECCAGMMDINDFIKKWGKVVAEEQDAAEPTWDLFR